MIYFLTVVIIFYLIYTLNFAIKFNSTNTVFNDNQMLPHNFLIWVLTFFWIMIAVADGLNCCVQSMYQDKSGNMWWGTGQGLYRFDGNRFYQVKQDGPR